MFAPMRRSSSIFGRGVFLTLCLVVALALSTVAIPYARQADPDGGRKSVPLQAVLASLQATYRTDAFRQINAHEDAVEAIHSDVLQPWRQAWTSARGETFLTLLAAAPRVEGLQGRRGPFRAVSSSVRRCSWKRASTTLTSPSDIRDAMAAYLGDFALVSSLRLDVHDSRLSPDGMRAQLKVSYDLRGLEVDGRRRQDRGFLDLTCIRDGWKWTLSGLAARTMETLVSSQPSFEESTADSGLDTVPVYQRLEAIRRGGYALAVGDLDGDGRLDVYVGAHGPSRLYRGTPEGRFVDVTAGSGLAQDTLVKSAAIVDLDNDGARDLVLTRFVSGGEDVVVYRNRGQGRLARVEGAVTRTRAYDRAMPMTVGDFNGDGLVDLYVGFPGSRDFTALNFQPQTLDSQSIFLNTGNGHFTDGSRSLALAARGMGDVGLFPHAAVAGDWNGDGRMDLMVVDDRRNTSPVYQNQPAGGMAEVSDRTGIRNAGWGMGVALGDYDGDGREDVYLTNIDLLAAKRIARFLPPSQRIFTGNRLFRNLGNGRFEDATERSGLGWAGEAAGGAVWIDYDNDGHLDLYVVNGLWTGPGRRDLESVFVRSFVARAAGSDQTLASRTATDGMFANEGMAERSSVMRLLAESGDGPSTAPAFSMAGHQRNCLFHNNGDGTFTEVGFLAGVDRVEDGYVAAVMDYDADGRSDLLLRNADPGTTALTYAPVVLLRNVGASRRVLAVSLQGGRESNRDALGATLSVWTRQGRQTRSVQGPSGASQGDQTLLFGLGDARKVDRLTVRWPSGRKETFTDLRPGRIRLTEGKGWSAI